MSAIGEYVHYSAKNYYKYGINRAGRKPLLYSGGMSMYIEQRKRAKKGFSFSANYEAFNKELWRNNLINMQKDQQLVNLDYGQKIMQLKNIFFETVLNGTSKKSFKGISKLSEKQLLQRKNDFDALQKQIDLCNQSFGNGETILPMFIDNFTKRYKNLNQGSRKSILGNIQQEFNNNAAEIWENTLNQDVLPLASQLTIQKASEFLLKNLPLKDIKINTKVTAYQTQDKLGSDYKIVATSNGWELLFKGKRINIFSGSLKNFYKDEFHLFTLSSDKINFNTILKMLNAQERFSTHWINRHSNHLDNSLDRDLSKAIICESMISSHQKDLDGDFVFIDRNFGQVDYQHFWDVIERNNFRITPDITNIHFKNGWEMPVQPSGEGAYARINKILQEIHTINLQVASGPISI